MEAFIESELSGKEYEPDTKPKMHKVCVTTRPLVMIGSINIRAMITILAKARLEAITIDEVCECPQLPPPNRMRTPSRPTPSPNRPGSPSKISINVPGKGFVGESLHAKITFTNNESVTMNTVMLALNGGSYLDIDIRKEMT